MPSIRRNIYLSEPQDEHLVAEARRLGISVTELLRRIVDQYRGSDADAAKVREGGK